MSRLTASSSMAGLDHELALAEGLVVRAGPDARERRLTLRLGERALVHPPEQVAVDPLQRLVQALPRHVQQAHLDIGQRRHLGDAGAHLAGADHADAPDLGNRRPAVGVIVHPHRCDPAPGQLFLRSSAVSSGTSLNRSPTRP